MSVFEKSSFSCIVQNLTSDDINISVSIFPETKQYLESDNEVFFLQKKDTSRIQFSTKLVYLSEKQFGSFEIIGQNADNNTSKVFKVFFQPKKEPISNQVSVFIDFLSIDLGGGFLVWYLGVIIILLVISYLWLVP